MSGLCPFLAGFPTSRSPQSSACLQVDTDNSLLSLQILSYLLLIYLVDTGNSRADLSPLEEP